MVLSGDELSSVLGVHSQYSDCYFNLFANANANANIVLNISILESSKHVFDLGITPFNIAHYNLSHF